MGKIPQCNVYGTLQVGILKVSRPHDNDEKAQPTWTAPGLDWKSTYCRTIRNVALSDAERMRTK